MRYYHWFVGLAAAVGSMTIPFESNAHKLRESGEQVKVAKSDMTVVPERDWNRLSRRPGKNAENWTLDGPQLNDVTFFGGIAPGKSLIKERNKKRDPLPKFTKETLLIEVPELLEGTYRTYKKLAAFEILSIEPTHFLSQDGVYFEYEYIDGDQLTRKGEARAAIIDGELYMISYDAPRLHYFQRNLADFRSLADSATLK